MLPSTRFVATRTLQESEEQPKIGWTSGESDLCIVNHIAQIPEGSRAKVTTNGRIASIPVHRLVRQLKTKTSIHVLAPRDPKASE